MADILIPFFNKADILLRCLNSVLTSKVEEHRIILIDDASDQSSLARVEAFLAATDQSIELIRHEENRGYKEAISTGVRAADHKHMILLNSDTVVTPAFDRALLQVLQDDKNTGAAAPVSGHPTDLFQYRDCLADIAPRAVDDCAGDILRQFSDRVAVESGLVTSAPYLTGMCLAIDRNVFEQAGMFGIDYRDGYFEDLALCCEIRALGFRLAIREDCFVYHQGHATYRDRSFERKREIVFHNLEVFESSWGHLPEHPELLRKMEYAGKVCPL